MVKVIIMHDGKVTEKEGELAVGFVSTHEGNRTAMDSYIIGKQNRQQSVAQLMAEHAVSVIKRAFDDSIDRTGALMEFEDVVINKVHEYVVENHEEIAADITNALKEIVGASDE